MKCKKIILLFLCFLSFTSYSQWAWQNPLPQGHNLETIKGTGANHCCAGGLNGTIISTRNGGNSWYIFSDSAKRWVRSVDFTDSLNGWAVGDQGFRFHTTDGGITWIDRSTVITDWFSSVSFVDSLHGWICNESSAAGNLKIIKTIDGGNTWIQCFCPPNTKPLIMKFLDLNHGWFTQEWGATLFCTNDGGNTWTQKAIPGDVYDFCFADTLHGCAASSTLIYTADGGNHWVGFSSFQMYPLAVAMGGPSILFSAGFEYNDLSNPAYHAKFGKSSDAGQTWTFQDFTEPQFEYAISYSKQSSSSFPVLWMAGEGGAVFRSVNNGFSWQEKTKYNTLSEISSVFIDKNFPVGWAAARNGYILKTSDGGTNWKIITPVMAQPITSIWFLDTLNGFGTGEKGTFMRSTDGGKSWYQAIPVNSYNNYIGIRFTDALNGWAMTSAGVLLHSGDGGNAWQQVGWAGGQEKYAFTFTDNLHGWAVGNVGTIRETHDGGVTWNMQIANVGNAMIWDVCFVDTLYGWCAADDGYSLRTTDGGKTWLNDVPMSDFHSHYTVKFFDHFTGYMTGQISWPPYVGFILKTNDGGVTWNEVQTSIGNTIDKLFANDTSAIYGVGLSGTIIKYTGNVIQTIGDKKDRPMISCFPNPFKDITTIKIHLLEKLPVTVLIYDSRGNMVMMFPEKIYPAGYPIIHIDMKGLPSGIYYYKVLSPESDFAGKMIKQ